MLEVTKNYQGIRLDESDPSVVRVIDQSRLPFFFETKDLKSVEDVYTAISTMTVRSANYGFDVTPARLIAGLITERGICRPSEKEIRKMFSDKIK